VCYLKKKHLQSYTGELPEKNACRAIQVSYLKKNTCSAIQVSYLKKNCSAIQVNYLKKTPAVPCR